MAFPQALNLTFGLALHLQQYSRVYCELRLGDAGSSAKGEVIQVKWPGTKNLGSTDAYMYGTESKDGSQVAMKKGDTYTIDEFTKRAKTATASAM